MKKYLEYKDSGIEWLGEIPKHWDSKKVKYLARGEDTLFLDGDWIESKDIVFNDTGIRYITTGNVGEGKYKEQGIAYITNETFHNLNCTEIFPGDLIISRLNPPIGRCCIIPDLSTRIVTSVDNVVLRPNAKYHKPFLKFVMSSSRYFDHTSLISRGATMQRISRGMLGNVELPVTVDFDEQIIIANYLDKKTSQIDSLIEDKEQMIELLKEERAAIINQAVTKGINPDAEMKDSEVEWLGEVPKHWEVKKMKFVAQINPTKDESINKDSEELVTFLPMECVNADGSISTIQKKPIKSLFTGFTFFRKNDIIFAKITPCFENGKGALLTELETECGFGSTEFHVLRAMPNRSNDKFLYFYTISPLFRDFGEAFMTGSAGQKRVPTDFVENFLIPNPTIQEQKSIVSFLEKKTSQIDSSITHIEKEISLIEEYRTALINETVTGKIDIRDKVKG